ncbi:MAG: D-alanyl-D-alanine carboxypeptidase family protein, partial [Lachnospiraceae bacterium]|nr:D-alanyl-D-alanine carboxypeptidase family protein [Candidatus Darwinimomas equi]
EYMHRAYSIIHVACPYFGFIVRYPRNKRYVTGFRYKPLHLRYVGEKAATYISKNKLTLEEYFL